MGHFVSVTHFYVWKHNCIFKLDLNILMLDTIDSYLNTSYKMLSWCKPEFLYHYIESEFTWMHKLIFQTIHIVIVINSKMSFHVSCVCIRQTFYMISLIWSLTEAITLVIWAFYWKCSDSRNYRGTNPTVASFTGLHKILISQHISSMEREESYPVSKI